MEELKRLREEKGWSQARLAQESGLDRATINQVEGGRRSPTISTLEALALALGAEVADFFPKVQASLPLGPVPPERGYALLARQFEDWRYLFEQAAEQWSREAKSGNLFRTADGALSYSISTNIQAAQFFGVINDRLAPALEKLLPKDLARIELQKLLEARDRLGEATEAVNEATLGAVPELAEDREFTDAELAMIEETTKEVGEAPQLEQRRRMREVWQIMDRIPKEQAGGQGAGAG